MKANSDVLNDEALSDDALRGRIERHLGQLDDATRQAASVCAIVETGLLTEAERTALWERFPGYPWLHQRQLSALQPLGPWLFSGNLDTLLAGLYPMAERGFHGLLLTHQPVMQEAEKLGNFCVVADANGEEQLLRYYLPHVLPIVHHCQDTAWYPGLFGSLSYWWLPGLEGWQEYRGAWSPQSGIPEAHETITLTPALVQALGSDPLSHQLLGELERTSPDLFSVACPGIRMAMVDKAIDHARGAGFQHPQDLGVYVAHCVAHGIEATQQPDFQQAVALSLATSRPLADTLNAAD